MARKQDERSVIGEEVYVVAGVGEGERVRF